MHIPDTVECASRRHRFEMTSLTIFAEMVSEVVTLRMQHEQTGSLFFRRRPVIAFVQIAAKAGVDQVRQFVRAARSQRTIMVNRQLRACARFIHSAITAAESKSPAYLFVQRVWHSDFEADWVIGQRQILTFQFRRARA